MLLGLWCSIQVFGFRVWHKSSLHLLSTVKKGVAVGFFLVYMWYGHRAGWNGCGDGRPKMNCVIHPNPVIHSVIVLIIYISLFIGKPSP